MKKLVVMMFVAAIFVGIAGTSEAQYGIGRYERLQVLADDLEASTRQLYFQAERESYPYRGRDSFALDHLRNFTHRAAIFRRELQTTDDPVRLRSAYQRLVSAYNDARYAMRGFRGRSSSDFVAFEFRNAARAMDNVGRTFFHYMDRRYAGDRYEDFDSGFYGDDDYSDDDDDDDYDDDDDDYDDD